jgi:anaerobic selenocysteine-containing dehydrogenase
VAFELEPNRLDFKTLMENPEGAYYQQKEYSINRGTFATPTGKIEIYSEAFEKAGVDPLPTYREPDKSPQGLRWVDLGSKYPLILSTGTRDFYFNGSMLHNIKSLQLRSPFPKAEIGPKTAVEYGISHGDDVIIETDRGRAKMKAHVDERIMEGVVLVPHGWPGEANCNLLTDCQCREPIMGYPQWKGLLCNIRKVDLS